MTSRWLHFFFYAQFLASLSMMGFVYTQLVTEGLNPHFVR